MRGGIHQMKENLASLLLDNQLCFPLYAAARKIVAAYTPLLKDLKLTYTQYITMMVLWEVQSISIRELGTRLFLDTGTLSPLLKRLESAGFLTRRRSTDDERIVFIEITRSGLALKKRAQHIPAQMMCALNRNGEGLTPEEAAAMKEMLYRMIHALS